MKLTIAYLFSILYLSAGAPTYDERIIGGGIASPGQFPYIISLTENNRHFCSGFIYSEKWVVTTASCIVGKIASNLKVITGQLDFTTPDPHEEIHPVYRIVPFSEYDATNQLHDLALLQLTNNISYVTPDGVYFINYNEVDLTNPEAIIMGWGAYQEGGFESIRLRYATTAIQNEMDCGDYTGSDFLLATMICTNAATTTSATAGAPCQYDQGSPLVQYINSKPTVVGVMSKNRGCSVDQSSVYTRLSVYYSWFLKTAGQQELDNTTVTTPEPGITNTNPVTTAESVVTTVTEPAVTTAETEPAVTTGTEPDVTTAGTEQDSI
ncbi:coagulation factor IX isoform X1 [Daphnia magna]|uniref:coagulation factor IX isoform X1 n=1 Tax=Daphnia magna TaxID=35525 RepID=UPI001E1BB638|nr:coagulation factor IX isoform X1 [Daphnia magna]